MTAIALSMIVRDEAPVIRRCLDSVRPLIDHALIVDTGSTDGTPALIRDWLAAAGVPGAVVDEPWRDFACNRSSALARLRERREIDYALVIDADDTLVLADGFDVPGFKQALDKDFYHLELRLGPLKLWRPQILSNRREFAYKGVLHEFVAAPAGASLGGAAPGLHIAAGAGGARSRNPHRYRDDALILEQALETESDEFIRARYTFYLALSRMNAGEKETALQIFLRRAELGCFDQEVYLSLCYAAELKEALGYPDSDVVGSYLQAYQARPDRAEALHRAMRYCRRHDQPHQGYLIGRHAITIPEPFGALFVEPWVYEFGLLEEFAALACRSGHYQDSLQALERILAEGRIPAEEMPRIRARAERAAAKAPGAALRSEPGAAPAAGRPKAAVVVVRPPGYGHSEAYAELVETVLHGLRQLGYGAQLLANRFDDADAVILIGGHHLSPEAFSRVPPHAVVYNTENAAWIAASGETYRALLQRHEVWDYSADNAHRLGDLLGKPVRAVPLGYVPELTRIEPAAAQDIDVLFYGSLNPRRAAILDRLKGAGLRVEHRFGVYGAERDALIARSKVVLNVHFYEPGAFEILRVGYLLANAKAVVTEVHPGEAVDADLMAGLVAVPHDGLVAACRAVVADDDRRHRLEQAGFAAFRARGEAEILADALGIARGTLPAGDGAETQPRRTPNADEASRSAPPGRAGQSPMNVLMLCHPYPNYVPDLLLHGLRKLLGDAAVDHPRKDALYDGVCGQPYLDRIPGLMAADSGVDRSDIGAKMAAGFFQIVIVDVRAFADSRPLLQSNICPLAVVDGEDAPAAIKPGRYVILRRETDGNDFSLPLPMALPVEVMEWIDRHADTPKTHSIGFRGVRSHLTPDRNAMLDELVRVFPDALIDAWPGGGGKWQGRDGYYRGLQSCKAVLSLPGAGYDTFRYWENAACNALHVAKRMPLLIPDDFRDGREIVRFSGAGDLVQAVERVLSGALDWREFAGHSRAWLRAHHTTEHRARTTLDRLKVAFAP